LEKKKKKESNVEKKQKKQKKRGKAGKKMKKKNIVDYTVIHSDFPKPFRVLYNRFVV
jgi:hypothetical protein